ncbi:fructosamine kinase family protein [Motiliproteus sp. MSK22-1]|uniref:fructosamine kinase family protein n=1 Tax=Motiliproteus sp. MSK22-1 TaxID=1897630 RepID=UPI0009789541|nr:fructosamine kinase family protein [Motiliproteus sp. MSK22-1]OMH32805.1 hypothetical protein BGP75_14885 [Motiliproteus sp. MSK22-1]
MDTNLKLLLHQSGCKNSAQVTALSGGCIGRSFRVESESGELFFYKTHPTPPGGLFAAEAAGLQALDQPCVIRVPKVCAYNDQGLLLEYLPPDLPSDNYWLQLGEQLAALHSAKVPCFGFHHDSYCGTTRQPNPRSSDGHQFFSDQRLLFQARMAYNNELMSAEDIVCIERICKNLKELVPTQSPSLIHGDLWIGNQLCHQQKPVLIDPAAHWGWAEAELAMTKLFGGFPEIFYDAYSSNFVLEKNWKERLPIYNLYHLMNHLNLFGQSYLEEIRSTIKRY